MCEAPLENLYYAKELNQLNSLLKTPLIFDK